MSEVQLTSKCSARGMFNLEQNKVKTDIEISFCALKFFIFFDLRTNVMCVLKLSNGLKKKKKLHSVVASQEFACECECRLVSSGENEGVPGAKLLQVLVMKCV